MKRRGFVKALAAVPGAGALLAQQPVQPPGRAAEELPKLEPSVPDAAADAMPRFFTAPQFAALRRVSDLLMPAENNSPGALAAGAPEFLDFLIGRSAADRQLAYRTGLDGLNAQAIAKFGKDYGALDAAQATTLLAPLSQPWTFEEPSDPVARFLRAAKADVRTATVNSREYAGGGGRRFGGGGLYWYPLD